MDEKLLHLKNEPMNFRDHAIRKNGLPIIIVDLGDNKRLDWFSLPKRLRVMIQKKHPTIRLKIEKEKNDIIQATLNPEVMIGYQCNKCENKFSAAVLDVKGRVPTVAPCPRCAYPVADLQQKESDIVPSFIARFITREEFAELPPVSKQYFIDGGLFLERI